MKNIWLFLWTLSVSTFFPSWLGNPSMEIQRKAVLTMGETLDNNCSIQVGVKFKWRILDIIFCNTPDAPGLPGFKKGEGFAYAWWNETAINKTYWVMSLPIGSYWGYYTRSSSHHSICYTQQQNLAEDTQWRVISVQYQTCVWDILLQEMPDTQCSYGASEINIILNDSPARELHSQNQITCSPGVSTSQKL